MNLKKLDSKKLFQVLYLLVFFAACLMLLLKPSYNIPLQELNTLSQQVHDERIGILEQAQDNHYIRFSAQYWLAPVLVIASDPMCCAMLIAHVSHLPVEGYAELMLITAEWYLLERQ